MATAAASTSACSVSTASSWAAPGPVPAPPGQKQAGRLHVGDEHGGPGGEHEDEGAGESAEDRAPARVPAGRRPARMRAETVQGDQQQPEQDGGADDGGHQGPAPLADGDRGEPGYGHPDRGGRQRGQHRPQPAEQAAELDEDKHGQPGAQHEEKQQPHAEMDRMATARLEPVPQLLVGEPGGLGRGEPQAGDNRGANRQRPAVAGLGQQARCLRVVGQQLTDDLGRCRPVIWPHGGLPSRACRSC